jgi:hypothetical protein
VSQLFTTAAVVFITVGLNTKMKIRILWILNGLILFSLFSCSSDIAFDEEKWKYESDGVYIYRDKMIDDLMENKRLDGLTYDSLVNLLGPSDNYVDLKKNELGYTVIEDYGWDIDPVYVKQLRIKFSPDSVVTDYEIWERKR